MSRSAVLMTMALFCVVGVSVAGNMRFLAWSNNPECLGLPDATETWAPVFASSSPNCSAFDQGGSQSYWVSSPSTSCPDTGRDFYRRQLWGESTCSNLDYGVTDLYGGCQNAGVARAIAGSNLLVCDTDTYDPKPYVTITLGGACNQGPVVGRESKRASLAAIFANTAATCVVYYNQTNSAEVTYVKLTAECNPALSSSVSFEVFSDSSCTQSIENFANTPINTCINIDGVSSYNVACLASPGATPGSPTPSAPSAPSAPSSSVTGPTGAASASSGLISVALIAIALIASLAL